MNGSEPRFDSQAAAVYRTDLDRRTVDTRNLRLWRPASAELVVLAALRRDAIIGA